MSIFAKKAILIGVAVFSAISLLFIPSVSQPQSYHHFADTRSFLGIVNFSNVISNLPFLIIGLLGAILVLKSGSAPREVRIIYLILFIGLLLTGIGSGYYHWNPNNDTLLWDRVPLTIVFMSLLSVTLCEVVSLRLGSRLLLPLVVVGISSVFWWEYTESLGRGDLRFYIWVQFFPILAIGVVYWLYYESRMKRVLRTLTWIVIWYGIAKVFESLDYAVYQFAGVSGHTLKHLAAAVSSSYFLSLFRQSCISSKISGNVSMASKPKKK